MPRASKRFARLMKVCRMRGRSEQDAEDLIQESLLRLWIYRRVEEVRDEEAFLVRTVARLAINQSLRQRKFPLVTLEDQAQTDAFIDMHAGPERMLVAEQSLERIRRILSAASQRTCDIFMARSAGYSHRELAERFGITDKTVEKHLARAKALLASSPTERD
jgi:RNA polymerase sigma factor (sigma-70 family)